MTYFFLLSFDIYKFIFEGIQLIVNRVTERSSSGDIAESIDTLQHALVLAPRTNLHALLRNIFGASLLVGCGLVKIGGLDHISTDLENSSWLSFQGDNVGVGIGADSVIGHIAKGHALGSKNAGARLIDSRRLFARGDRDSSSASNTIFLGSRNLSNRGGTWLGRHRGGIGTGGYRSRNRERKPRSGPLGHFGLCIVKQQTACALIDELVDIGRKLGLGSKPTEEILH